MSVLIFLLVLSILILVHEAGHYFAARRAGVWVEEFGFGLPPRVIGKRFGETLYSINLLPFGGFVRLHGENVEEGVTKPDRAFINKSKKARAIIILAGVFMNFILAIVSFSVVYSFTGVPRETENVRVVVLAENSPAIEAGLKEEDVIKRVDDVAITSNRQFIDEVENRKGNEIVLTYLRDGEEGALTVVPRQDPPEGQGALGVVISSTEAYYPPIWQRPFYGMYYGFQEAVFWGGAVISGFSMLFVQLFSGNVPQDVAGPVGIYALTTQAATFGIIMLINFIGILSVNLAILNIFPFPALDGGRLVFIIIESIIGKKVTPRVEAVIHSAGMVILLLLILAITASDIRKLISAGGVTGYIEMMFK
jgi:regulator of sigma E protease